LKNNFMNIAKRYLLINRAQLFDFVPEEKSGLVSLNQHFDAQ